MCPTAPNASPTNSVFAPSLVQFAFGDLEQELASTRRMLERFPSGHDDWSPHEKSTPLARLATHVADIPNRGTAILETSEMDLSTRQPVPVLSTADDLLAFFDANVGRLRPLMAAADFASLRQPWTLRHGERTIFTAPKGALLRTLMISHFVHHRAQLGGYYRMLGVPVPGMYGPSADEAV
jgi:uncharacterized damage-inducible protein DinB